MPNLIQFGQGTLAGYTALASKDQYQVYFTTDTHQIFLGADEYTKGTKVLAAAPTTSTVGDQDRLYAYNGSLYLCTGVVSSEYQWVRVANVNDTAGTVTSIAAGEGLETTSGSAITDSGTIQHAVPTGAAATADSGTDQTPGFGQSFNIKGIATDKFGHVTGINDHSVTLPTETPVAVSDATGTAQTLTPGDSFTVITGVARSTALGATDHDLVATAQTFTLPADQNVTYEISSVAEGVVTLTGSDASSSTAKIDGWDDLAKKSDITSVFKFKGKVASEAALPTTGVVVGDVYLAEDTGKEFVCIADTPTIQWEELGPIIDLSPYATTAWVEEKLTWKTF